MVNYWTGDGGFGAYLKRLNQTACSGVGGSMASQKEVLIDPIFNNNPIALQVLGICSALAVTINMATLVMCWL